MALVQPYLIYCIPLWGHSRTSPEMDKLFKLQKKCIRIALGKTEKLNGTFQHTKPMFRNINVLNVFNLYTYFTAFEAMKILADQSPKQLFECFVKSTISNRLILPKFKLTSFR